MPRNQRPAHAERITDYATLRQYARRFGQGLYNCLIFVGPPGRLKSSIIEAEAGQNTHLISGNARTFECFCEAQEHIDWNLVFDDANGLYSDHTGQRFLKQITNPRKPKTVSWHSDAPLKRNLKKSFRTNSNVAIIDNAWNAPNEHIVALEDRSRLFLFDPSPAEIHQEMDNQDWFVHDDVYRFIGDNLCFLPELSARSYVKAAEAKEAGEDWREYLLKAHVKNHDLQLLLMEYDKDWRNRPVEEKCKEWCRQTGSCRATYFNRKKSLLERMTGHPLMGRWSLGH